MKKKALAKDFRMEIKTSLNRFLSIFFIVALGVAFFSGIRASEPDMRYSGDAYFDSREMMDLKVLSTLGLTQGDIEAISQVNGVDKVEPGYMIDVLSVLNENEHVIHIESLPETMNQLDVYEGRLAEEAGECVVDVDRAEAYGIKLGDELTFESGNDKELSESLVTDTYKVVGICSSPVYISFDRGSTNIGSGEVDMFAYVAGDSFNQEVYSQAWVSVAGAREELAFTDGYRDLVAEVKADIENIADGRCDIRYAEIKDEADEKISEAESELESARTEVESELSEAEQELKDGEKALAEGKAQLAEAEEALADARAQLSSGRTTLDEGWSQYFSGLIQAESGKSALLSAEQSLLSSEGQLNDYEAQLEAAGEALTVQEEEIARAESAIEAGKAQFGSAQDGWQQYQGAMSGFETMNNQLKFLESKIEAGMGTEAEIAQAEALRGQIASLDGQLKQMAELLALMDREAEIVGGRQQLEVGRMTLETSKSELISARSQLTAGKDELEAQKQSLAAAEEELAAVYTQLTGAEWDYTSGLAQIQSGEEEIAEGYGTIDENEEKLAEGWQEYAEGKKEAEEKISDAEVKILDARNEIEGIAKPSWYVNDRDSYSDYSGYSDNADRMRAIGEVFPILFFLVAALVSLTTMTRMVEEQRTQIGTLKALGYSRFWIAAKYLGYALAATLGGSLAGVLIGQKIFPYIIVMAYKIMYIHIPDVVVPYHLGYSLAATGAAVACTMLATVSACYHELGAQPAELMRPEAPKAGKRVLLERMPWIWGRLSFTWKSTVRNLLRYKKRFFMTVFGIGGCMALMLVGYGLKDSIMDIAVYQYGRIQVYDMMAVLDEDISDEAKAEMEGDLASDSRVDTFMDGYMKKVDVSRNDEAMDLYLYVPSDLNIVDKFIIFGDRVSGEKYTMDENSAILTEKAAKELGVSKGDEIEVRLSEDKNIKVQITDICENYLAHYLYLAPQLYEALSGETDYYNCIFTNISEAAADEVNRVGESLLKNDGILSVSYTNSMEEQLEDMLSTLDSVIIVLIISAGMLAFVVLYNLNNININERKRELATLKVLGFYDGEVAAYVFRENMILTLIGAAAGVVLGKILHLFVIQTVEVEMTMFGRNIDFSSFVYAIIFTVLFSLMVNGVMYFKLRKIDMVESLKSVE